MRSISLKIILVLVVVSLAGALFTAFFIQSRTQKAFNNFILDENQVVLTEALIDHYQTQNNWEGVESLFKGSNQTMAGQGMPGGQKDSNSNRMFLRGPMPFVLADKTGTIIGGGTNHPGYQAGDILQQNELRDGIILEQDGEIIGWLVVIPIAQPQTSSQQTFLNNMQEGLIISSSITLLIALLLGGILIISITRPIRKLAAATEIVAGGELGYQTDINSQDELGKLSVSFNNMSAELAKADQTRKQMTADIAHDLRTPLSVLSGYTEAMSDGKLEGNHEIYGVMKQQTQHLNYLIDDLRTLSLLDSNELNFQISNIDPGLILQNAYTAFSSLADEKDIQLIFNIDQNLPRVNLDPDRLNQILGNLLSNAINILGNSGEIHISASTEQDKLQILVWDNGPGIEDDDILYIFDRFYRADKSRDTRDGSSGLGLAITRKLVEGMDGSISVNSELGIGTTFQLEFPIA